MSDNYSGDSTATQAPSPAPSIGGTPIIVIPEDTDPNNVATMFEQQFKMTADWLAFLAQRSRTYFMDTLVYDEFTGDSLNRGKWINDANLTFPGDAANGAKGAVRANLTGNGVALLNTIPLNIGTGDFYAAARVRIPTLASASSFQFGFPYQGGTYTDNMMLVADPTFYGSNTWRINTQANTLTADTTVAYSSSYQKLELYRIAGVVYARVNGSVAVSVTPSPAINAASVVFGCWTSRSGGNIDTYVDYVRLWIAEA